MYIKKPEKTNSEEPVIGDVARLLRDLLHALLRSSTPAWVHLTLTLPQLRTLFIVAHHQAVSVVQVSRQLGVGEPTASHLIDKLVQAGLLSRREDPRDRRRMRVELSAEGTLLIERLLGWESILEEWLQQVSKEDLSLLQRGLTALIKENPFHGGDE